MRQSALAAAVALAALALCAPPAAADWKAGLEHFEAGRYAEAVREFEEVAGKRPKYPDAHYMLGAALLELQRAEEAAAAFQRALELEEGEPRYRLSLAKAQLVAGRPDDCLASLGLLEPASLPEDLKPAYGQLLAIAADRSTRLPEALPTLERGAAALPDQRPLWIGVGKAHEATGDVESAIVAYHRAIILEPSDEAVPSHAVALAWKAAKEAPSEEGKQKWNRTAVELAEGLAGAVKTLNSQLLAGEARSAAGEWEAARRWFDEAAKLAPDDPVPRFYRARCAAALGNDAQALTLLEETLARKPQPDLAKRTHDLKGLVHHRLGQWAEAAAAYRQAGAPEKAEPLEAVAKRIADCEAHVAEVKSILEQGRATLNARDREALEKRVRDATAECEELRKGPGAS